MDKYLFKMSDRDHATSKQSSCRDLRMCTQYTALPEELDTYNPNPACSQNGGLD